MFTKRKRCKVGKNYGMSHPHAGSSIYRKIEAICFSLLKMVLFLNHKSSICACKPAVLSSNVSFKPNFFAGENVVVTSFSRVYRAPFLRLLLCLATAVLVHSCSQEKTGPAAMAWHNTLARYNGYFIAKEKMKEFEFDQLEKYKDNYNKVLDIYPFPALGSGAGASTTMDEIVKKASIPIQRHKNSKWVDDCYQLIGQARFYKEDWENAIQSFKYINTKFKDKDARHKAVIWLLITYTRMGDVSNAKSVMAFLKKETLSKNNLRDGAMAFSYFYLKRKEYQKVSDYLSIAVELLPRGKQKARLSYALGQLHQKFKRESDAFASYSEVLRNHPSFELEFYTRLNMAQTVELADARQLKKIRKNFKRMTTDLKYEEYLDKVYYEMGLFEIKQGDMPKGLAHLRTSLKKSKSNTGQKPYTYLKLAEIHYSPLRSYVWAKQYYDSTMTGLDTTDDNYKATARRQKVLTEFVKHYTIVQTEDSLLRLANVDTTKLYAMIDSKIRAEQEKKDKADKAAKKLADAMAAGGGDAGYNSAFDNMSGGQLGNSNNASASTGGSWYFGNLVAVGAGRTDFRKKWGNRKLEDNWRRSSKETQISDDEPTQDQPDTSKAALAKSQADASPAAKGGEKKEEKDAPKLTQAQLREPYLKDIPRNDAAIAASHAKIQVALLEVGKIYDQQLDEPHLAAEALEREVKDYPTYEKVPEALYNLCLIYRKLNKPADFERCKELLLQRHPESLYAKLLLNPNYLQENKQRNEIVAGIYKTVFDHYKANQFIEASNGISTIRAQYPKSAYEDKLAILSALITAKTVDLPTYKKELNQFLVDYPKSDLQEFAKACLKNLEKGAPGAAPLKDSATVASTGKPAPLQFSENLDQKQFFLAMIPATNVPESDLQAAFSDFNLKFYPGDGLEITTLPFGDQKHTMIKIQGLASKIRGMYYVKKVEESGPFTKGFKNLKPVFLLVTQENLMKLYSTKALAEYKTFYDKNYNLNKTLDDDIPAFGK